jgi:antitoxin (DNA-binding transcriptional repressor) of toxin-antitoxin stability system
VLINIWGGGLLVCGDDRSEAVFVTLATGGSWPVAEIAPVRPKRELVSQALTAKISFRAGPRMRTTGQDRP